MKLAVKAPLALGGIVFFLGVVFASWLHITFEQVTEQAAREQVMGQLTVAVASFESTGGIPAYAALDDAALPAELRGPVDEGQIATYLTFDPPEAWAAQRTNQGAILSVRTSWESYDVLLVRLDADLLIGVVGLSIVAALLTLLVASTLSRRLRAAETGARAIAEGNLSVRVGERVGGSDEVAELGRTVDALAASMQERLDSEKRITADIAHDLRTPLTGLVTAADLLPPGRPSELVRSQVQALRRLVENLLEVARLDEAQQEIEIDTMSTVKMVERAISASSVKDLTIEVVQDVQVRTDPRRVDRVLVNLIENAGKHGRPPLTCRVDGRKISVCNYGEGFPTSLIESGPRRFRTGSTHRGRGHGLGLTIAAGQARALGAVLSFSNVPDGEGVLAVATIALPESPPGHALAKG